LTTTNFVDRSNVTFSGIPLPINGLAESFRDAPSDGNITENIAFVVDELIQTLATSDSKFTKVGSYLFAKICFGNIQKIVFSTLDGVYPFIGGAEHGVPLYSLFGIVRLRH